MTGTRPNYIRQMAACWYVELEMHDKAQCVGMSPPVLLFCFCIFDAETLAVNFEVTEY